MNRTHFAALIGTIVLSTASLASGTGFKVVYNGGSIQKLKPGTAVTFRVEGRQLHVLNGDNEVATIPTYSVSSISYRDDMARREGVNLAATADADAASAYRPNNHRSIILTWSEGERKGGFAMQCEPTECQMVLAAFRA
jgi:hypothetical protein